MFGIICLGLSVPRRGGSGGVVLRIERGTMVYVSPSSGRCRLGVRVGAQLRNDKVSANFTLPGVSVRELRESLLSRPISSVLIMWLAAKKVFRKGSDCLHASEGSSLLGF